MRKLLALFALSFGFAGACSAAAPDPVHPEPLGSTPPPQPPPPPAPAASLVPDGGPIAEADGGPGDAGAGAVASADDAGAPAGPTACPEGMKLVEGDYCSEVEHHCKKSWFDKSNKKTVCEEFEPTAKCVGTKKHKRYCIDTYEWPNKKGERPEVMNRFHQAEIKCAAVGKRMCSESEWTFACEGPEMKPFPYGYVRDATKCNGDHMWDSPNMKKVEKRDPDELARLWKGVRSGSQPQCISDFGVADLPANADEVVFSEQTPSRHAKFDSVHTGGPWYRGVRNQCRPKIYTHDEDFYYYFLSFRCCAEPDGKPTDPRTERQIKDGWTIQKVEKRAQFTIKEMQDKLELKKTGKCECAPSDILCKTMCGTLLGPGAQDTVR
ncbi:MAG: SUMF1/EgtB/PvdO family nonheme iron enzyme [Byssovorax sp.]